jgi:hypothetical protein
MCAVRNLSPASLAPLRSRELCFLRSRLRFSGTSYMGSSRWSRCSFSHSVLRQDPCDKARGDDANNQASRQRHLSKS